MTAATSAKKASTAIAEAFVAAFGLLHRSDAAQAPRRETPARTKGSTPDFEIVEARDKTLRKKYRSAIYRLPELRQRALTHAVAFTPATQAYVRAAILDYLDNPDAATDLDITHFTACYPSPDLPEADQLRMHHRFADLRRALMRRDHPGWTEHVYTPAEPAGYPGLVATRPSTTEPSHRATQPDAATL
jgi:hypothetical protein